MDDLASCFSGGWAEADFPVCVGDQQWVVVDDDDGVAGLQEEAEAFDESLDVCGVQSDGGFIEDEEGSSGAGEAWLSAGIAGGFVIEGNAGEDCGDAEPLCFASGEGVEWLAERQVAESGLFHGVQAMLNLILSVEEAESVFSCHLQNLMRAAIAVADFEDFGEEPRAGALAAGCIDIGKELHGHGDLAAAFAGGAAATAGYVEAEHFSGVIAAAGFMSIGEESADVVPDSQPRGGDAPQTAADRLLIEEQDVFEELEAFECGE